MTDSATDDRYRRLEADGFALVCGAVGGSLLGELRDVCEGLCTEGAGGREVRAGIRVFLDEHPGLCALLEGPPFRDLAALALGGAPRAVRVILFHKTDDANWKVPWHQDCTVAVRERRETPGFTGWSVKAGVPHAQAPASVLERMVTLRIHLDRSDPTTGALEVLSGSHRDGVLTAEAIRSRATTIDPTLCAADPGDVLLMKPLLLHRSLPATAPSGRRVVHAEFSATELPGGLEWR